MSARKKLPASPFVGGREPRVLLWDIETDGLQADRILCIGYKFIGRRGSELLRYDQFRGRKPWWSDKPLLQCFTEVFNSADYHATWYGSRFDQPVVEGRLVQHGLAPLQPKPHLDLWKTAREKLGHRRQGHRLQAWQDRLGLREDKTPVKPSVWIAARHGDTKALSYIYKHCEKDVLVLEGTYERFLPWLSPPSRALFTGDDEGCPVCGSHHIQSRGYRVAQSRIYRENQCQDCGKWFRTGKAVGSSQWRT